MLPLQDKPSGHLKIESAAEGRLQIDDGWRDNGRGAFRPAAVREALGFKATVPAARWEAP